MYEICKLGARKKSSPVLYIKDPMVLNLGFRVSGLGSRVHAKLCNMGLSEN